MLDAEHQAHLNTRTKIINVKTRGSILLFCLLVFLIKAAGADPLPEGMQEIWDLVDGIKTVASALGALILTYSGIRWIMADSPSERDDAKKTIIYVVIALIVVALTKDLVHAIYCETTNNLAPPYGGGIC